MEATKARDERTAIGATQPLSLANRPRGYDKIAEERRRRHELDAKARVDKASQEEEHRGDEKDPEFGGHEKRAREDNDIPLVREKKTNQTTLRDILCQ